MLNHLKRIRSAKNSKRAPSDTPHAFPAWRRAPGIPGAPAASAGLYSATRRVLPTQLPAKAFTTLCVLPNFSPMHISPASHANTKRFGAKTSVGNYNVLHRCVEDFTE